MAFIFETAVPLFFQLCHHSHHNGNVEKFLQRGYELPRNGSTASVFQNCRGYAQSVSLSRKAILAWLSIFGGSLGDLGGWRLCTLSLNNPQPLLLAGLQIQAICWQNACGTICRFVSSSYGGPGSLCPKGFKPIVCIIWEYRMKSTTTYSLHSITGLFLSPLSISYTVYILTSSKNCAISKKRNYSKENEKNIFWKG